MKTITTVVTAYKAEDGTVFPTKELCATHDRLQQLSAVIEANWGDRPAIPSTVIATLMVSSWDELCAAMKVHNEDQYTNQYNEPVSAPEQEFESEDAAYLKAYERAVDYANKWAEQYTTDGVGCRTYDANFKEAFIRKMAEFKHQSATAAMIDWFDEYPELTINVIQDAMIQASRISAINFQVGSDEFYALYTIELNRLLEAETVKASNTESLDGFPAIMWQADEPRT